MNRKSVLSFFFLCLAALLLTGCATAPSRERVVLQVSDNDPGKWNLALNNAKNVQDALGGPARVDIEIVAYGPGIGMLKADALVANRVADAVKNKVAVVACENTMTNQKLTQADMNPAISYVPTGVLEIMERQKQGWAYVRP